MIDVPFSLSHPERLPLRRKFFATAQETNPRCIAMVAAPVVHHKSFSMMLFT